MTIELGDGNWAAGIGRVSVSTSCSSYKAKIVFAAASLGSRDFGPDSCVTADPAYIRTADETGGMPLFFQRSEAVVCQVSGVKAMGVQPSEPRAAMALLRASRLGFFISQVVLLG